MHQPGSILLVSCYEPGHQPLALASPVGFLRRAGYSPGALNLSIAGFDEETITRGIPRISESAPSGCTYWRLGAKGQVFYTEASDHFDCLIGAYTHSVSLPPAQDKELEGMIETMVGLNYLNMVEVPSIPRREEPLASPSTLRWCRNFSTRCRRRARQCKADDVAL